MTHLALYALRAQGYWEYVQSKSNWADDISRLGIQDPWRKSHRFSIGLSSLPLIVFQLPFLALILVLSTFSALGWCDRHGHTCPVGESGQEL